VTTHAISILSNVVLQGWEAEVNGRV